MNPYITSLLFLWFWFFWKIKCFKNIWGTESSRHEPK